MKFEELKKSLSIKIEKNYLITGKDVFLADNTYRLIKDKLNITMPELNVIKFNDVEVDFESVVSALLSPAVFDENKLVYIDLTSKYTKIRNIDKFSDYLASKNFFNYLIVRVGDNTENLKLFDNKNFINIDCESLSKDIACKLLMAEVKKYGKKISQELIDLLLDYTNGDLQVCINEINKLCNYVKDEITKTDIDTIVNKTLEYKIYELTEALAKKNINKVYSILADLKNKKSGYHGLIALIYTHFRRLLHISITKLSVLEYADLFGIKEYPVKKAIEQVKLFKPKKLKEINDLCIDLEYKIKTSQVTSINAVDMLVIKIVE